MNFSPKCTRKFNKEEISILSKKFNLDESIISLLFMRGITNENDMSAYLNPTTSEFNNPFDLSDMQKVIDKINYHINNNSKIVILGDYDTDGISASAIMYKFLKTKTDNIFVFLPNRIADGYGLSLETIDKINEMYSPNFIITVDCGISAKNEVDYCLSKGIDIVITDHHDIPETIPNCLIINPKLPNQKYPFKELCGAGVALKIVQAFIGIEETLNEYTTLAAIATVADIVPLIQENRCIVSLGLKNQEDNFPLGIKKLLKHMKCELPIKSTDISFKLAPKLNATGRMGDAIISFNLLIENDEKEINKIIAKLIELNDKRLDETNKIIDDVLVKLENVNISKLGAIVLYNSKWESGVLGIICSKLVEKYNRPTCILTKVDDEYKGSLRSVPGINIFEALNNIKDCLIQFGGHNQAAGVTIDKNNLEKFKYALNDYILKKYSKSLFLQEKQYDLDITKLTITEDFIKQLDVLEPCGLANEKPQFKLSFNNAVVNHMPNHYNHICAKINNLNLVGFNFGDYVQQLNTNSNKEIILELQLETFRNKPILKGMIKFIKCFKLNTPIKNEFAYANYISQLNNIPEETSQLKPKYLNDDELETTIKNKLNGSEFGTVIISNTFESYLKYTNLFPNIQNFELENFKDSSGVNTIIYAPVEGISYKNYVNIFFVDPPISNNYLFSITTKKNRVFTTNKKFDVNILKDLSVDRKIFAVYHKAISNLISKNLTFNNMYHLYESMKKINPQYKNFSYTEFKFVCMVLSELGIFIINDNSIKTTNIKSELNNSKIYVYIKKLLETRSN